MKLSTTFIKIDSCKRVAFIIFMGLISISFFSKNVLSVYRGDNLVEMVELMENGGEENESEREEANEEIDDYTNFVLYITLTVNVKTEYTGDKVIWNNWHSEIFTPPPERA